MIKTNWISLGALTQPKPKRVYVYETFESGKKPLFDLIQKNPGIKGKEIMRRLNWTRGRFAGVMSHFKNEVYGEGFVLKSEVRQSGETA